MPSHWERRELRVKGSRALLDHLVGAGKERWRHREAERLGGLEVDYQLLVGACTGRSAGFSPFKMRAM